MDTETGTQAPHLSLVVGGPFHTLLTRLGLTAADRLPTPRAAIGLALLAWAIPALFAIAQAVIDGRASAWGYFTDASVYARYLIAIWAMIATERYADRGFTMLMQQFHERRIIPDDSLPAFERAFARADRRTSAWRAELLILVVAVAWSAITTLYAVEYAGLNWLGADVAGMPVLSWAGEAVRFWSNPIFLFLALRWFWRFYVWTALLYRISRLPLQLQPMHADRAAGLGFLAIYPSVFSGLVFALSCVITSGFLRELEIGHHSLNTVWLALAVWLAIVLILFVGPLFVFVPTLYAARQQAFIDYGRLANQHHLAFHRKWIEGAKNGEDLMGSSDLTAAANLNASVQAARNMHLVPVDYPAIAQLVIAAGIPLLPVILKEVPLVDIVKWLFGKIL